MSTTRTVGIGLVGCGTIGPLHARAVAGIEGARLVAVADLRRERSEKLAAEHGVTACSSMDELLGTPGVDLVSICTPSGTHGELGAQAARAGRHVVVEKPVDTTMQAARDLVEACHKAGVVLSVISQHRFDPGTQRLKATLDAGGLGRVLLAEGRVWWYRSQGYYDAGSWRGTYAQDGGALMNQGIHTVDLLLHLLGPVRSVFARATTAAHRMEAEDLLVANLAFASGVLGVLSVTTASFPGVPETVAVTGTSANVVLEAGSVRTWDQDEAALGKAPETAGTTLASAALGSRHLGETAHRLQLADVVSAIRNDHAPAVRGEDGLAALGLVLAAYESARTGTDTAL
jgi:predicted dehydrogenase